LINRKLISNQRNFISSKGIARIFKRILVDFYRGQQTKGLKYDTTMEFFDEIDPKVRNRVLNGKVFK
jgi:hypothetical protein